MAADGSRRTSVRSDASPAAGAEPGGRLEADRGEPGQARAESQPALPGAATVRVLEQIGRSPIGSGRLWADGRVRRCDRASTLGLFALERGDIERAAGVVQIRRAYANGRVRHTKTRLSRRAVPLQAIAVEALDQLRPREDSLLLFANACGGYLDFRNVNRRRWKPVQKAVGVGRAAARPLRPAPHLHHLRAPREACRCSLSRFMGTSIAMIDLHYGDLAVDSYQHAVSLLDTLALDRAVDAGWMSA